MVVCNNGIPFDPEPYRIKRDSLYVKRVKDTDKGIELLNKHFNNFVVRIGAYIREMIKNNIHQNFFRYEFDSIYVYPSALDKIHRSEPSLFR